LVPCFGRASDGRIALLNPVDNRVLIYDPREEAYSSFPLPFSVYPDAGDLAFDQKDQLMVCDSGVKSQN
jgi:sugar lactone lactonase YvrE